MQKEKVKTITLKLSENTMNKMSEYFEDKKRLKTPPYAVFQADEADTVVTLYNSGKAVFQGISADIDANMWSQMERHLNPNKKVEMTEAKSKKEKKEVKDPKIYYSNSIGSDEVGTGDYFGPIVVTAAYVTKEDIPYLETLGIKDSKKMTDEYILKVVPEIIKKIPYYTMTLSNEKYNQSHDNYNMNAMKAILHNKALLEMAKKYPNYDYIVVDQFAEKYVYYNYLKSSTNVQRDITFITKAEDKCLAVACGAVISRFVFLKEMEKISKTYNVNLPKGAGLKVDEVGKKLVKEYGKNVLNKIAKLNFKNTEKILND